MAAKKSMYPEDFYFHINHVRINTFVSASLDSRITSFFLISIIFPFSADMCIFAQMPVTELKALIQGGKVVGDWLKIHEL
jgi:hypothetical protein